MVNNSTLPVMEGHDWQPALGVPGQNAQMASISWPGTSVEVTYAGISVGGVRVVNWTVGMYASTLNASSSSGFSILPLFMKAWTNPSSGHPGLTLLVPI